MTAWTRRPEVWVAGLVFLAASIVYMVTLYPTVPFWDAGEFIGVSYILGIPHPPGTPFYVMLGRIATMVPWASVAERVNAMSAIPAALAVMLTYLTTLKLIQLAQGGTRFFVGPRDPKEVRVNENAPPSWIAHVAAVTGALMIAFSDSFWENAIEAEVYALMSLAQILVLYLGLRWWEAHERKPTSGPLLLCVYVMWLCVGLHLGVAIMGLPLILLVAMIDKRAALVFAMPFLATLLVTMGMQRMAGGILALSALVFLIYAYKGKLNGWVALGGAAAAAIAMAAAFGDDSFFTSGSAWLGLAALVVPLVFLARRSREGKIIALALFLMVAGYSTHVFLPIRAAQSPAINEGNPATWQSLRDLLERKQYGQMNMFVRRAPVSVQLDKEFWRYFSRQWPIFPTERLWGTILPILLGLFGAYWQARRSTVGFLYTGMFVALTTAGLILFLNFSANEVRERDYFFQSGYHAYSIWIGLGVAAMIHWVRDSFAPGPQQRWAALATGGLLALMPFLMLKNLWYTHDRRGDYVAKDYAHNMLNQLAPNSFVFTNGDNDTFPLWYIQEVEGFRKDVRVVNLSLLNTEWYIRQLQNQEPKVPIELDEETLRALSFGAVRAADGSIIYTNEYMVQHIMEVNRNPDGTWKKQPYFAVTVPNHHGLDDRFTLEGLVYRVNPEPTRNRVDEAVTRKALYEDFRYRGLFGENGEWDPSVYKDSNAATLSRNYAAAHIQLAYYYRQQNDLQGAIAEMERVVRMFPDFFDVQIPLGTFYIDAGDTAKALDLFRRLAQQAPNNPEVRYYHGVTELYDGHLDVALQEFEAAIGIDPGFSMGYYASYYALWEDGQQERALGYLERWVTVYPEDRQARALLETQREAAGLKRTGSPLLPKPPQLP